MTTIVVIAILGVMLISSVSMIRAKAERGHCVHNLQSLYAAGAAYLADHESWPQISTDDVEGAPYAKAWISALEPYKIDHRIWICPTLQKALHNPAYDAEDPRVDYIGTPFDSKPSSPYKFPTQPWFIERAAMHGDGNLIIFTNGQMMTVNEAKRAARSTGKP